MGQTRNTKSKSVLLPLNKKKFFCDLPNCSAPEKVELQSLITRLGGVIQPFLDREVQYLITSRIEAKHQPIRSTDTSVPSPFTFSRATDSPLNPDSPVPAESSRKRPISRSQAIVQNAKVSKCQGTAAPLKVAASLGIKVVHSEQAHRWLREKIRAHNQDENRAEIISKSRSQSKNDTVPLNAPYIKLESTLVGYRPLYHEYDVWPQINFLLQRDICPFESTKTKRKQCSASRNKHRGSRATVCAGDKDQKQLCKAEHRNKSNKGYCELCRIDYITSMAQHISSDVHRRISGQESAYSSLDMLINQGPNMEQFLSDVIKYQPQHAQEGQKEFQTFPQPSVPPSTNTELKQPAPVSSPRKTRVKARQQRSITRDQPAAKKLGLASTVSPARPSSAGRGSTRPSISGRVRGTGRRKNSGETGEHSFVKGEPSWYQDSLACSEQLPASTLSPLHTRRSLHPSCVGELLQPTPHSPLGSQQAMSRQNSGVCLPEPGGSEMKIPSPPSGAPLEYSHGVLTRTRKRRAFSEVQPEQPRAKVERVTQEIRSAADLAVAVQHTSDLNTPIKSALSPPTLETEPHTIEFRSNDVHMPELSSPHLPVFAVQRQSTTSPRHQASPRQQTPTAARHDVTDGVDTPRRLTRSRSANQFQAKRRDDEERQHDIAVDTEGGVYVAAVSPRVSVRPSSHEEELGSTAESGSACKSLSGTDKACLSTAKSNRSAKSKRSKKRAAPDPSTGVSPARRRRLPVASQPQQRRRTPRRIKIQTPTRGLPQQQNSRGTPTAKRKLLATIEAPERGSETAHKTRRNDD